MGQMMNEVPVPCLSLCRTEAISPKHHIYYLQRHNMVFLEYNIIVLGAAMPWKSHLPDLQTQVLDVHHFHVVVASPSQHNLPRPSFPRAPSTHPPPPPLPGPTSPRPLRGRGRGGKAPSGGAGMRERGAGRPARLIPPVGGAARRFPLPFYSPERKRKEKKEEKGRKGGNREGKEERRSPPQRPGAAPSPAPPLPGPNPAAWLRNLEPEP